jgi:hypothetical protein
MKRSLLAVSLLALGCGGGEAPARLEVEMLSVTGQLDGRAIDEMVFTDASGERVGNQGSFFFEGPTASMQLAACPLGDLEVDPYGQGGGVGVGIAPTPIPDDAGVPERVADGTIGTIDCDGRGIQICDAETCAGFAAEDVDIAIVEENGWRRVVFDATGSDGDARVELLYRETH